MIWRIDFDKRAFKDLAKVDSQNRARILRFLSELTTGDPRRAGAALQGPELGRYWKYRVGDYRVICSIQDSALLVLVVRVGHRKEIYR
jgi:mRNA interferase RelE/StbE